jgi:glycosidase
MLAEDEAESELLHKAFNINYGWEFHHIMNSIAQGEADANAVAGYYTKVDSVYPKGSYMMHFTSNHDENSWNGTVYERMGDAVKTMAALSFTLPGMPLIYSGQEAGNNKRLEFFEKDEIDWSKLEMQQFYAKLIDLKQQNKALWNGCEGGSIGFASLTTKNNILAFIREADGNKIVSLFNLSDKVLSNQLANDQFVGDYTNALTGGTFSLTTETKFELSPWEFMILIGE